MVTSRRVLQLEQVLDLPGRPGVMPCLRLADRVAADDDPGGREARDRRVGAARMKLSPAARDSCSRSDNPPGRSIPLWPASRPCALMSAMKELLMVVSAELSAMPRFCPVWRRHGCTRGRESDWQAPRPGLSGGRIRRPARRSRRGHHGSGETRSARWSRIWPRDWSVARACIGRLDSWPAFSAASLVMRCPGGTAS